MSIKMLSLTRSTCTGGGVSECRTSLVHCGEMRVLHNVECTHTHVHQMYWIFMFWIYLQCIGYDTYQNVKSATMATVTQSWIIRMAQTYKDTERWNKRGRPRYTLKILYYMLDHACLEKSVQLSYSNIIIWKDNGRRKQVFLIGRVVLMSSGCPSRFQYLSDEDPPDGLVIPRELGLLLLII